MDQWQEKAEHILSQADGVFKSISENIGGFSAENALGPSLRNLFDALDANKDGAIQFEEFQGMTVQMWATIYQVSLASLFKLDSFKDAMRAHVLGSHLNLLTEHKTSFSQIVVYYLLFLLLVQTILYVGANIHNILGQLGFVRVWHFPTEQKDRGRVPKEAALCYDTPIRKYEIVKIIIMVASGLMVFRLVMSGVCFLLAVSSLSCSVVRQNKIWQSVFKFLARTFIRLMLFFSGYYVVVQHGSFAPLSDVKLLCGNHVGAVEVVILFVFANFPSFVSREENLNIPLFPGVVQAADAILVNRDDKDSKRKTIQEIIKRSQDPKSPQLMIFPEGTCGNQHALFKFSKGAFVTAQPVQPIVFRFPYRHFNPCFSGRVVGGNDLGDIIFRTMCQFVNRLEYKCLDVYHPSEDEKADPELYAANVERLMAISLGIPQSEASYADYKEAFDRYRVAQKEAEEVQQGGWTSKRVSATWGSPAHVTQFVRRIASHGDLSQHSTVPTNSNSGNDNKKQKAPSKKDQ